MTQPLAFWTAATPNGWKVSIMIEELRELGMALPSIEVITVDIMNGEQFSDAFTAVSANQKIPGFRHRERSRQSTFGCYSRLWGLERVL